MCVLQIAFLEYIFLLILYNRRKLCYQRKDGQDENDDKKDYSARKWCCCCPTGESGFWKHLAVALKGERYESRDAPAQKKPYNKEPNEGTPLVIV